ncbi:ABC transporter substrate-binding protein [Bacteroidales bacterium OttesenSCG-928-B11]|nr:ABC transporter substrate-binding protein [Bacteroidales bacterium OttesenSCG-928-C03]MDL2311971.1 ABC transporter substrate-binding protein [Bacteroidales bacterium OttesenSCG-928-B11]
MICYFKYRILLVFAGIFLLLSGCKGKVEQPATASNPSFCWTDSYGREVVLMEKPERIVSLSPGITEMVFMLGAGDYLVGISDFCKYPPETEKIAKVGGMQNFSIEYVVSLKPDVVLIGSIVRKDDVNKIEMMGIPVIAIREEEKIEGIYNTLTVLGKMLGKEDKAAAEIEAMKEKMSKIDTLVSELPSRPKLYYVAGFGDAGDFTAPAGSHIHEILSLAGGQNIGAGLSSWAISREFLFQQNPDYIIIRKEDAEHFCQTYPYTKLTAVINSKIIPIESGWIDIVSPRNIWGIELINEKLRNEK